MPVRAPMGAGAQGCGWYLHCGCGAPQLPLSPSLWGEMVLLYPCSSPGTKTLVICRLAWGGPGRARPQHPPKSQRSCWSGLTPSPPSALQPLVSQAVAIQVPRPQQKWGQEAQSRQGLHLSRMRPRAVGAQGSDAVASHSPGATRMPMAPVQGLLLPPAALTHGVKQLLPWDCAAVGR